MKRWLIVCFGLVLSVTSASAQVFIDTRGTIAIDPARGTDPAVDYPRLIQIGPWDDRNYALSAADLAVLAPNEAELRDPIPAFFRVAFRKAHPDTPTSGPVQYPRSAVNVFRQIYGGFLVNGVLHAGVTWSGSRFYIDLTAGGPAEEVEGSAVVSGEVRVTSPNGAAESAIKFHPSDTSRIVAGTNGPGGGQKMHYSTDGGSTWTETTLPLGGTCCDPAVDWSSDGTYAYTTTLGNCFFACGVWFYRSNDGGVTWNGLETVTPGSPRRVIASSGGDKEFLHVDKYALSPYKDNLYVTWHNSNVLQFSRSTDFGNTWSSPISVSSGSAELGIGSDIATDQNGHVYYLWPAYNSRTIRLAKSTNGGASFTPSTAIATTNDGYDFAIPAMETRRAFIYVGAESDLTGGPYHGTVYATWTDTLGPEQGTPSANHARIQVGYSRNGGSTWTVTTPHETADQTSVDRFHPWIGVASDGTVYVAFYDTRRDPTRTSVDFFYSKSVDGGQTWSAPERLTTQISPNITDGFEWGDYNGLDAVMHDMMTIFTDNRSESGGTGNSVDVYAAGVPGAGPVCGNDTLEAGEACDGTALGGKSCADFGCTGGTLACKGDCSGFDTSACSGCPVCDNDGTCELGEDCTTCPSDCVSGSSSGAVCGNGICEAADGEDCLTCPSDCNGVQSGKPTNRYCCGAGGGTNPVPCLDTRCTAGGKECTTVPTPPGSFCCGDLVCGGGESCANCAIDCASPNENCSNGLDDDCNGAVDCVDPACSPDPICAPPPCLSAGASCSSNSQCCSNKCRGGTCR